MTKQITVDLNCDVGESYGAYRLGNDEALLPYVTSANIACGFHAGDPAVMKKTVRLALENNVALGAHPGLPDLVGFGRRELKITPEEAFDLVVYQMGALAAFAKAEGEQLHHVKPHGALYNMAAVSPGLAQGIAQAIYQVDPSLTLFGLAGSELIKAGTALGLPTAQEVFADRTYASDGTLTPRSNPNALILDTEVALRQVLRMVTEGKVRSVQGEEITIKADTICIHGDGSHAVAFAREIRRSLAEAGVEVEAPSTRKQNQLS